MLKARWTEEEKAIRIYLKATLLAHEELPATPPEPANLWRRLIREVAA